VLPAIFEEETDGFYYRVVKMTQHLKGGNGSVKAMGDKTGGQGDNSFDKAQRKLAERLLESDNLPESHIRMVYKAQLTMMFEGANAGYYEIKDPKTGQPVTDAATGLPVKESFHNFSPDVYLKQCHLTDDEINSFKTNSPKAYEAYRRWITAALRLEIMTELGVAGTLPSDSPPHLQKLASKLMELVTKPLPEEVRIAREVEIRTSAYKQLARALQIEFTEILKASSVPDVIRLGNLLDSAYKRIENQDTQIIGIRQDAAKFADKLRAELDTAKRETTKKENTITALNGLLGDLTKEKEDLENKLTAATKEKDLKIAESAKHLNLYTGASQLSETQKGQLKYEREQNGKLATANQDLEKKLARARAGKWTGWIAAAGASLLAVGLWNYRPSQPVIDENVPQEVITYSKDRVTVRFGDVKYDMSADRFTQIYEEFPLMQQKAGRHLTPSERKKYFDSNADKERYIKDLPKNK